MKRIFKKPFLFIVFIIFLAGLFIFRIVGKITSKPPLSIAQIQQEQGIPVEVLEVKPGILSRFINVTGFVGSEEEAFLSSKTGGRILKFYKDVGDIVRKGDKIVGVDTQTAELQRTQAENQVQVAKNNSMQAKAKFEDAKKNLERMKSLFEDRAVSKKELEDFELNFDTSKQQYEASVAQFGAAQDNLKIINTNIQEHAVFAPFDGILGVRKADIGEIVDPGEQVISIYNLDKLNAQVQVAESDIPDLEVGRYAVVTLDALPGKEIEGRVTKISGAPDPNTRLFEVHIGFDTIPAGIKPGLFLHGRILESSRKNIIVLPFQFLIKEDSKYFVFTVEDGKAVKTEVEIGERSGNDVEIVSGLNFGARVISFGKENVKDGSFVKITN